MLDQLGLADDLAQDCFAVRSTVSYNKYGQEVDGRGWKFMENMGEGDETVWNFVLVLRQRYQEEIFRGRLKDMGVRLEDQVELVGVSVDEGVEVGGYRVRAVVRHSGAWSRREDYLQISDRRRWRKFLCAKGNKYSFRRYFHGR